MTSNEMSLDRFFLILRERVKLILGIFVLALTIAGIITYVTPKMYTATSTLNFDFRGNPVDNQGRADLSSGSYISTQIGIIGSQKVAQVVEDGLTKYEQDRLIAAIADKRSVIDDLKSAITSPLRLLFSGNKSGKSVSHETGKGEKLEVASAYGWLARSIGGDLAVKPIFNSRIVQVSYSSTDRQVAALMANKISEAYIRTSIQMIIDPAQKSNVWFEGQLMSLRKRLEDAQSRLTEYQQQEGIVSSDERLDTEVSRLNDLSGQLINAQLVNRNAQTEKKKLQEVLERGDSLLTFEPVFSNPVVQHIKAEMRNLEGEIVESSASLGRNHPKMKKINSELFAARKRLKTEIQAISDGINNTAELSSDRVLDLEAAVKRQKQLVLDLKNKNDRIVILQREVESSQSTYNAALNQLNTTNMRSMVDQTNVSMVDSANIPGSPSSPQLMKNLAMGALVGLVLGIVVVMLTEVFVRRVYSKEDLLSEVGVPLLGHLDKI